MDGEGEGDEIWMKMWGGGEGYEIRMEGEKEMRYGCRWGEGEKDMRYGWRGRRI